MTSVPELDQVAERLENWRRGLIDLSHRNRLIAFKATKATTLRITAPTVAELLADAARERPWDFYFPPEPEDEAAVEGASDTATTVDRYALHATPSHRGRRANEIEVTELSPKRIARILDNLAKRSNTEFQDKALRILYVAVGFLDWHDARGDKAISSPLVLVPAELRRESTRHPYRLFFVPDEDIVINPSLTEKLRRDAGLDVPADWAWEDKPIGEELDEIRRAVAGHGWQVREEAVIGLFSFQKYVMFRDLLDNAERVGAHPIVRSLAQNRLLEGLTKDAVDVPAPERLDDVQPVEQTLSILDADASQRVCIEAAKRGQSFVMQGPPGTGKSQTIANVIAEAIGQGKRVLFVSEKAAALDVVHKRLSASGLDEYCLMLHGERAGRREVVQALDQSLHSALRPEHVMRKDERDRLEHLRTLLNQTANLLHLSQPLLGDRSVREVLELLAGLHAAASVAGAPEPAALRGQSVLDEYHELVQVFERLAERWHVSPLDFVWRDYAGAGFGADDRGRVLAILRDLAGARAALRERAADAAHALALPAPDSCARAERLTAVVRHLHAAPSLEPNWLAADPQALGDSARDASDAYSAAAAAAATFARHFPARTLDAFAADAGDRLRKDRDALRRAGGWTQAWDDGLAQLPAAVAALEGLPTLIDELGARTRDCADRLGQRDRSPSRARVGDLAELADLAFTAEQRPEAAWLVRAGHERAQAVLADVTGDLCAYQQRVASLNQGGWSLAALELDADALGERFRERYTSFFARLSGDYRRDARALKAVRADAKLPAAVADDLATLSEARAHGARLDAAAPRMSAAFGARAAGRDSDPTAIAAALVVSGRVLALSDADVQLDTLCGAVAAGSAADPALAQAATRLRSAAAELDAALDTVQPFVAFPERLFAGDLDGLQDTIGRLTPPLQALASQVQALDDGADTPARAYADLVTRAQAIDGAHAADARVISGEPEWRAAAGSRFAAAHTPWEAIAKAAEWLDALRTLMGVAPSGPIADGLLADARSWPDPAELANRTRAYSAASDDLAALFEPGRAAELGHVFGNGSFETGAQLSDQLGLRVDELHDWTEFKGWRARARDGGWEDFTTALVAADVEADDVVAAFRAAYWNRRLEALYDADPQLADDLRGGAFAQWVAEFRTLDQRLVATGADRLIERRERLRSDHVSTPGSEIDLLRREARKKARHLPVRKLLERIPTLLSELKPCLMMSPLTVSHFLSPEHHFDLVVFDEASQVPPQDAVNCIYRGAQLVVAGDGKQLPPTHFFQVAELDELSPDEEDAETHENMESILDSCEALLPSHPLRWHYRSRAEQLIAFSNRHIYHDLLVTFPSAHADSERLGVGFTHVPDGVYDRGRTATNRREAQVVAEHVIGYLTDGRRRSVGVIAFNAAQAAAITEELDLLRAENPALEPLFAGDRLDAVFVKHLEAVQGDERDVIVFSVGFGYDAKGSFPMNFGPLGTDGGHRRLNVAVTRARERIELVASVRAADFKLSETSKRGPQLLRDYVAYAENGGSWDTPEEVAAAREWPSPLEEQIGLAIAELGYTPVPQVGAGTFRIDIGVREAARGRFLLGIECDGPAYARTPTTRDRERLRHEVLATLGWGPIHRIWSRDWVRNRAGEIERLRQALAAAAASRPPEPAARTDAALGPVPPAETPRTRVERIVPELDGSAAAAQLPWTRFYERARLGTPSSYYEFHETVNRREQTDLLVELVKVEAPISIDAAIGRLAKAWGLGRAGHRVVAAGRQAISQATRREALVVRGEFLWRPDQTLRAVRIPDPDDPDTRREIEEIAPEEIELALARLAEQSPGIDREQLIVQTARVLGFDRVGGRIRAALEARCKASGH